MTIDYLAIVQARTNSSRLPGKVLKDLAPGKTCIEFLLERLKRSKLISKIVIGTTLCKTDDFLADLLIKNGHEVYRGDDKDVLLRYYEIAKLYKGINIVRITGDCPLIDHRLVDEIISAYQKSKVDYLSNTIPPTFPDGLDVEIFNYSSLEYSAKNAKQKQEREHVTLFIKNNKKFKKNSFTSKKDYSHLRWTIDEYDDLKLITSIIKEFDFKDTFKWKDVIKLYDKKPDLFRINSHIVRNEGLILTEGQKLWKRAKRIIPGGNMLLSKRPEMFLPGKWPTYFSKAKGCEIWDLEGNKFFDTGYMGVGTNTLGYGHEEVDKEVTNKISAGNLSTLNCPEEVLLAEKLINLHGWADMVKLARTGGEANSISIRIARAATGTQKIAICGYHGWHDWYLASNLKNENKLAEHLLPGLEPAGVPEALKDSVIPFSYNKIDQLEKIFQSNKLAAVKMEVERNKKPEPGFLQSVRDLCDKNQTVLIFDECTSGFRETFGGLHLKYGVIPDLAVFGKALGNGYAITAIIGTREIMESAQKTFISSTFWTERIGPSAALKTLEIMEREKSWEKITQIGIKVKNIWKKSAENHGLNIQINGLESLLSFTFDGDEKLLAKTLFTQEMLKLGYLSPPSFYAALPHNDMILEKYSNAINKSFTTIASCESINDFYNLLDVDPCHSGFQRLN